MHVKDRPVGMSVLFASVLTLTMLACVCVRVVVCSAIIGRSTKGFKKYLFNFITAMPIVSLCFYQSWVVTVNSQKSSENV